MNYQVITEPRAEADIREAFRWIAEDSPKNALRWQQGLEAAIDSLETFPERCTLAPENEAFRYEAVAADSVATPFPKNRGGSSSV